MRYIGRREAERMIRERKTAEFVAAAKLAFIRAMLKRKKRDTPPADRHPLPRPSRSEGV